MSGHRHAARISWTRGGAAFTDHRYSRLHDWTFDGGVVVPASASPHVVPPPLSAAAAVDPEEALVAAAASCHMLWFLSLAADRGFVVEAYTDDAYGEVEGGLRGKLAFVRIVLRPDIRFSGAEIPGTAEIAALHDAAHEACFIANSLRCPVVVADL